MNAPTLLCGDRQYSIPFATVSDMQLTKLLSDDTCHMLTHPCGGDVILLRQELFRLLDNECVRDKMSDFAEKLRALSKLRSQYKHASVGSEKLFLLAALEACLVDAWRAIPTLRGCTLTDALADYWCGGERTEAMSHIDDAAKAAKDSLSRISVFDMSFFEKSWLAPDYGSVPFEEIVRECADALGFAVGRTEARMRTHPNGIEVSPAVDAPFCALFADTVEEARAALVPYDELPLDDILQLLPQVSFCLDICGLLSRAHDAGLPVCFPRVSAARKYTARGACDVTLLYKNAPRIVPNDIDFAEDCAFSFLVGANGGGKTTYLRCVGANLILFLAGAPIFAADAEIYPFRNVRTHFPADERLLSGGRLEDEARRVASMLDDADDDSFLLYNETYSGTNDKYGCALTEDTGRCMKDLGLFGIFVTHFHELTESAENFDFLEAVVAGEDNARTFKIERRRTNKSSFARDILKKYGLDRESLEGGDV